MLFPPGRSEASAVIAGIDWAIRNVATPARTSRMRIPAPVALPEKRRSPIRRTVRRGGACEVVVTPAPGGSARSVREGAARWKGRGVVDAPGLPPVSGSRSLGRDRVDRLLAVAARGVRDRRGAGLVGRGLLAVLADHVAHERLDQVGLGRVVVLGAADVVADQHDRVLARVGGGPVEIEGEVVLPAPGDHAGAVDHLGGGLGRRLHELVADLDLRDAQRAGLALVGVADRTLTGLDGAHDTGGAVRRLAALARPLVDRAGGPRGGRGLRQVVGEVLGGTRLV